MSPGGEEAGGTPGRSSPSYDGTELSTSIGLLHETLLGRSTAAVISRRSKIREGFPPKKATIDP